MPRSLPSLRSAALALRGRAARVLGRARDPFADSAPGLALSPSARHVADYETAPLTLRFATAPEQDVAAWQALARSKLAELAGYRREAAPPSVAHEAQFPLPIGGIRRRVYLRARAGVDIPIHLFAPREPARAAPVMLCLQGTNGGAHLSWGEVRLPADADMAGYDFALQAAARGYLAVAIEQSCFGERAERAITPRSEAPCVDATMHALLLGRSLLGERCSDVSAVVDWLVAEAGALAIDPARIYAMGHSAGGSVAMFAAALDPRIAGALACGCVGFVRETIARRRDNQGQNVIPGILNCLEIADVVGLVAPRPFVTVAGETDPIWPAAGAVRVCDEARAIYAKLGAAERLRCLAETGGHVFRPDPSWKEFAAAVAA
jgi:dienelactone hydrolase